MTAWDAPLRQWFTILDEYEAAQSAPGEPDVAYWYNERATLSTLAGALWRSGALVLEEYRTRRGGNGPDGTSGRADLWCRYEGSDYTIEAKQDAKMSYPATPASLAPWAAAQLTWASAQCSSDNFGGKTRLALVFMVPSLLAAPTDDVLVALSGAAEQLEADLKATYLKTAAPRSPINGRHFPGVILLGRLVTVADDPSCV